MATTANSLISRLNWRTAFLVLTFVVLLVYSPSLTNDFILGDDYQQILENPLVTQFRVGEILTGSTYYQSASQSGFGLFYRPLMLISFALVYQLVGANPVWFHVISLVLHILASILLLLLIRQLVPRISVPLALLLVLGFALHPLNAEVVLHISNLQESLFMVFGLGALLLATSKRQSLGLQLLLLFLSMLAKETGLLFVLTWWLYYFWFSKRQVAKASLVVMLAVSGYLLLRFQVAGVGMVDTQISQIASLSHNQRLLQVPYVVGYYLYKLVWPVNLSVFQFWIMPPAIELWLVLLGVAMAGGWHWRRLWLSAKSAKLKEVRLTSFFITWIVAGLLFHSQIWPLYLTVADRWVYFTSAGIVGLLSLWSRDSRCTRSIVTVILALVVSLYALLSFNRGQNWQDSLTLFTTDLPKRQQHYFLQNMLASWYLDQGELDQARQLLELSVEQFPFVGNLSNLAIVEARQGRFQSAYRLFEQAIEKEVIYEVVVNYVNVALYLDGNCSLVDRLATEYLDTYPYGGDLYLALAQAQYCLGDEGATATATKADNLLASPLSSYVLATIRSGKPLDVSAYVR